MLFEQRRLKRTDNSCSCSTCSVAEQLRQTINKKFSHSITNRKEICHLFRQVLETGI